MKKMILCVCVLFCLCFGVTLFAACGTNTKNNTANEDTASGNVIPIPDVPDIGNTMPAVTQPIVDEAELTGDADTAVATAVIILKGDTAEFTGANVAVNTGMPQYGTIVEISKSGTYIVRGTLRQGFIAVTKKEIDVTIILNGVNIYCSNFAAITCLKKSNVTIELAAGSTNYLTDGGNGTDGAYSADYDGDESPNATILIRKDLTIRGGGKLIVNGGLNNGIGSRANLTIEGGDISVNAINNAIKGNDSINISGGSHRLISHSDGIKTESVEEGQGVITISGGTFIINSVNDAVQSATNIVLSNATLQLFTGGGSNIKAGTASAKGLKAAHAIVINSGTFVVDSNDDCIHSDNSVTINGGTFTMATADDGIHANETLTITNCDMTISKCYEGLEAYNINLNGGTITLKASDDGVNISGGKDGSANVVTRPGFGRPGQGGRETDNGGVLTITGGSYVIYAGGDGLDSNGSIIISGGTIEIHCKNRGGDGPIDYDGTYTKTGGTITTYGN
jgi:hypothetical protein